VHIFVLYLVCIVGIGIIINLLLTGLTLACRILPDRIFVTVSAIIVDSIIVSVMAAILWQVNNITQYDLQV